jgi:2-keto-4-pentenoate hydratase/2-oxohepta-3-ene-1,7-dioic acid hydratase in catechol pathway
MKSALKLLSFTTKNATAPRVGAMMESGKVFDVTSAMGIPSMHQFIEGGNENIASLKSILSSSSSSSSSGQHTFPFDDIKLLAPIPVPKRNVMCVGKNYIDHVAEVNSANSSASAPAPDLKDVIPKWPVFFTKAPECVVAPFEGVESHSALTKWLDYEVELAVIIGKQGRDISKEDALHYVFGYSIGNDITAREIQKRHLQWFKGKSLDRSCPMGPYIVPSSDIKDASK